MIDWLLGLLTPAQWDAWRGWLTTLGGLVALFVATSTYLRNGKIKREEQARLVYSKVEGVKTHATGTTFLLSGADPTPSQYIGGTKLLMDGAFGRSLESTEPLVQATVVIHNGSKELIGPARAHFVNAATNEILNEFSVDINAIDPESNYRMNVAWVNASHPGQPSLEATVVFRDASGEWWRRHGSAPIQRLRSRPQMAALTESETRTVATRFSRLRRSPRA